MTNELTQTSKFILYTSPNGDIKLDVFIRNETLWLTQKMMAELFDVEVPAVSKHLANIFDSGELEENSVVSILETTASDGKIYKTKFYNLDAVIAVGYRVNSQRATQFRIWATQVLREYIIKGFALNDERLKQGEKVFGQDYFRELLEREGLLRSRELKKKDGTTYCTVYLVSENKEFLKKYPKKPSMKVEFINSADGKKIQL